MLWNETVKCSVVRCSAVKCSKVLTYYSGTNLPLAMHMSACLMHSENTKILYHPTNSPFIYEDIKMRQNYHMTSHDP